MMMTTRVIGKGHNDGAAGCLQAPAVNPPMDFVGYGTGKDGKHAKKTSHSGGKRSRKGPVRPKPTSDAGSSSGGSIPYWSRARRAKPGCATRSEAMLEDLQNLERGLWAHHQSFRSVVRKHHVKEDGWVKLRHEVTAEVQGCFWLSLALVIPANRDRYHKVATWLRAKTAKAPMGVSIRDADKYLQEMPWGGDLTLYWWDAVEGVTNPVAGKGEGPGLLFVSEDDDGDQMGHWLPVADRRKGGVRYGVDWTPPEPVAPQDAPSSSSAVAPPPPAPEPDRKSVV